VQNFLDFFQGKYLAEFSGVLSGKYVRAEFPGFLSGEYTRVEFPEFLSGSMPVSNCLNFCIFSCLNFFHSLNCLGKHTVPNCLDFFQGKYAVLKCLFLFHENIIIVLGCLGKHAGSNFEFLQAC